MSKPVIALIRPTLIECWKTLIQYLYEYFATILYLQKTISTVGKRPASKRYVQPIFIYFLHSKQAKLLVSFLSTPPYLGPYSWIFRISFLIIPPSTTTLSYPDFPPLLLHPLLLSSLNCLCLISSPDICLSDLKQFSLIFPVISKLSFIRSFVILVGLVIRPSPLGIPLFEAYIFCSSLLFFNVQHSVPLLTSKPSIKLPFRLSPFFLTTSSALPSFSRTKTRPKHSNRSTLSRLASLPLWSLARLLLSPRHRTIYQQFHTKRQ